MTTARTLRKIVFIFSIVILLACSFLAQPTSSLSPTNTIQAEKTNTHSITNSKQPFKTNTPGFTVTPTDYLLPTPDCRPWTNISLNDVGKVKCVYGIIYEIINNDEMFAIRFSDSEESFYLYSTWVDYDILHVGEGVLIIGIIKDRENIPIIELRGDSKLYPLDESGRTMGGYIMPNTRL